MGLHVHRYESAKRIIYHSKMVIKILKFFKLFLERESHWAFGSYWGPFKRDRNCNDRERRKFYSSPAMASSASSPALGFVILSISSSFVFVCLRIFVVSFHQWNFVIADYQSFRFYSESEFEVFKKNKYQCFSISGEYLISFYVLRFFSTADDLPEFCSFVLFLSLYYLGLLLNAVNLFGFELGRKWWFQHHQDLIFFFFFCWNLKNYVILRPIGNNLVWVLELQWCHKFDFFGNSLSTYYMGKVCVHLVCPQFRHYGSLMS